MSRHTQGSLAIVGAIAAGIFLVAFVALMVVGGYTFSPAAFLALLVALLATIVLYLGFGGSPATPAAVERHVSRSADPVATAPAAAAPAPAAAAEPAPAPEAAPEPAAETSTPDYDGDGVQEGENEGTKPATLDGPRDGKADNLKEIKGVGPKMEEMLHGMGFYHFDQIANWTDQEVAWVDANLEGFKGRVSRDNWVEQAKILASGGETEFSKRVEGGDVY